MLARAQNVVLQANPHHALPAVRRARHGNCFQPQAEPYHIRVRRINQARCQCRARTG